MRKTDTFFVLNPKKFYDTMIISKEGGNEPYWRNKEKMATIKDLTIEEKLRLICGKDCWSTMSFEGKVESLTVSDGPVGLRTVKTDENGRDYEESSIAYPSIQVLADTWNKECAKLMGEALKDDCLENGIDILLAPGVNIKRHPLNGRNFEYFSEDPFLAGTMGYEYVKAMQDGAIY